MGPLQDGQQVAIIGGGPGGVGCALRLMARARSQGRRLHVALFEGKDFDHHYNQCVGVLSPPVEEVLQAELGLSLPRDLIKRRIYGYRLYTGRNKIFLVEDDLAGPTYTVRRVKFDQFLLGEAEKAGVQVVRSRVTSVELPQATGIDEVRIYSESGYLRAHVVVGAFGLDEGMLSVFEQATGERAPYRRPAGYLKTFVTKLPVEPGFIERKLGNVISAFLLPPAIPALEFGAITPKGDHIIINIAGRRVTSADMDAFLDLPEVKAQLPPFARRDLAYFEGRFPTAPAKRPYGDRYVMVGDATGWLRPFKGKGINTALVTGIRAADAILEDGVSGEAFRRYAGGCRELLEDYYFGVGVRLFCKVGGRWGLLDPLVEQAKTDPALYRGLYDSVSGQDSYKNILQHTVNLATIRRVIGMWARPLRARRLAPDRGVGPGSPEGVRRMDGVLIRRLTVRDIEAILRIDEKITGRPNEAFWASKLAEYIERDPAACLAAELEGKVVGFILGDIRGWEFNIPRSGWLEIMGVDPDHRGSGIGRKLAEALFEHFKQSGVDQVHTMISWNDPHLVEYFRSLGFSRGEFIHLQKPLA